MQLAPILLLSLATIFLLVNGQSKKLNKDNDKTEASLVSDATKTPEVIQTEEQAEKLANPKIVARKKRFVYNARYRPSFHKRLSNWREQQKINRRRKLEERHRRARELRKKRYEARMGKQMESPVATKTATTTTTSTTTTTTTTPKPTTTTTTTTTTPKPTTTHAKPSVKKLEKALLQTEKALVKSELKAQGDEHVDKKNVVIPVDKLMKKIGNKTAVNKEQLDELFPDDDYYDANYEDENDSNYDEEEGDEDGEEDYEEE